MTYSMIMVYTSGSLKPTPVCSHESVSRERWCLRASTRSRALSRAPELGKQCSGMSWCSYTSWKSASRWLVAPATA